MATGAYVMIKTTADKTKEAYKKISTLPCVKSFDAVTGRYDVILYVEGASWEKLSDIVLSQIRSIDGIVATETFWCLPTESLK